MKNLKKVAFLAAVIGMLGFAGVVYAATVQTPAEIAAGLTGKSVEDLYTERASGKTYGAIAKESGKLDEFKALMLEAKKAILDERVKNGELTQEQAEQIYNSIQQNQALCDGSGNAAIGMRNGASFGRGMRMGAGIGRGQGVGVGLGAGRCLYQ